MRVIQVLLIIVAALAALLASLPFGEAVMDLLAGKGPAKAANGPDFSVGFSVAELVLAAAALVGVVMTVRGAWLRR
jgi:hypothetical protein